MSATMTLQDKLHRLFLLDQQLRGLRTRLDAATRTRTRQQARLDQLHTQHAELLQQLTAAQVHANAFESQCKDIDGRTAKRREQMKNVRNHKEYSALLVEVNTLKVEKGKLEDQALEHLTKVDELRKRMDELAGKMEEQKKLVGVADGEVAASRAEVGQQLDEVTAQRNAAAAEVPPEVLSQFEKLADEHEGEALAHVVIEDRRRMEYTCGGCFMGLPRERVNALFRANSDLVTCPNCRRILYADEALKDAFAAR